MRAFFELLGAGLLLVVAVVLASLAWPVRKVQGVLLRGQAWCLRRATYLLLP